MADSFLELPDQERELLLRRAETETGRSRNVLEKDVWVCWTLEKLFALPERQPMVFKGGTSLSKVYNAIARFSEDIDVTIDWRGKGAAPDPFALSRSGRDKERDAIIELTRNYVANVVRPYFQAALQKVARGAVQDSAIGGSEGEQLRIFYPSVVSSAGYLGEGVLLEFGGRNSLEPDEKHDIEPYVRSVFPKLFFPSAKAVPVLSPQRTFWEKVTLVHAECGRPSSLSGRDRICRHWYDLAMLADHEIGRRALADRELLKDVVKYKKAFYRVGYADYDACLHGKTRLVPSKEKLADLERDFNEMKRKSMFVGTPPSFTQMMNRLNDLARVINET